MCNCYLGNKDRIIKTKEEIREVRVCIKLDRKEIYKLSDIEIYKLVRSGKLKRFPNYFIADEFHNPILHPEIVRYLFNNILQLSTREEILKNARASLFNKNKLSGLLACSYGSSPIYAVQSSFPEFKAKEWEFVKVSANLWAGEAGKKRAIEAVKWMIEEKLGWTKEEIVLNLSTNTFIENRLAGLLVTVFDNSVHKAISETYPGLCEPWELNNAPMHFWTLETATKAVRWLVEDKLKWSKRKALMDFSSNVLKQNRLSSIANNYHPMEILCNAFPEWDNCIKNKYSTLKDAKLV